MAHEDSKDLKRRTLLIKYYVIKHLILLNIQNMMDINVGLLQWFIHILIKKASHSGIKNESISNKEIAEESHKPIIRNF